MYLKKEQNVMANIVRLEMNKIYLRVSTDDKGQEFDRQKYILESHGYILEDCEVYEEKESGKSTKKRLELKRMLEELSKGDVVVVSELSRLARSTIDLWTIANEILTKECVLICIKENFDLSTAMGRFTFNIFGSIAQLERETISERTKDGLAAKRKNGVKLGRPVSIDRNLMNNAIEYYKNNKLSYKQVGEKFGISGVSIFNEIKKEKQK
jgi:DNA invertase Pin-like site-specific DNA recombinase